MELRRAKRSRQKLRILLTGATGSGKTFTALRVAHAIGGRIGVIDTENGSAELYADETNPDGGAFEFDVIDLAAQPGKFSVENYIKAIGIMAKAGVDVLIVDSGSHAWAGPGGVLEYVDNVAAKMKTANTYAAWREGTPKYNEFLQALLSFPGHVIVTLRSKMDFVQEGGKIRKIGLAPIMRDGIEYEFTLVGDIDCDTHRLHVTKSRIAELADRSFTKAGKDLADPIMAWLERGAPEAPKPDARQRVLMALETRGITPAAGVYETFCTMLVERQRAKGMAELAPEAMTEAQLSTLVSAIEAGRFDSNPAAEAK